MDLKQEAARAGASLIVNQQHVGLGEGSTIAFLVSELQSRPVVPGRVFYSSSEKTKKMLQGAGFYTGELSGTGSMDIYFDGCDQMDHSLSALKSGAGIHSMEKLLATMATEFILLGDESKYVKRLDGRFPLVVEAMEEGAQFVKSRINGMAPGVRIVLRETGASATRTSHGNILFDCWLPDWSKGKEIAVSIKQLPGVLDTSLFTGLCRKAVIAGMDGARIVEPV